MHQFGSLQNELTKELPDNRPLQFVKLLRKITDDCRIPLTKDQYTAQIVNTLELSAPHQIELKKPLQPGNQPGEVSNNKYMMYLLFETSRHVHM